MSISVRCSHCQKKLTAKDELSGKRVKCPACGQGIVISSANQPAQPRPVAPASVASRADSQPTPKSVRVPRARWIWYACGGATALGLIAVAVFHIGVTVRNRSATENELSANPATNQSGGTKLEAKPLSYQGSWMGKENAGLQVRLIYFEKNQFPCRGNVVVQYRGGSVIGHDIRWEKQDGALVAAMRKGDRKVIARVNEGETLSGKVFLVVPDGSNAEIEFGGFTKQVDPPVTQESLMKAMPPLLAEVTDLLRTIRDVNTANQASVEIAELAQRMQEIKSQADALAKLSPEEEKRLQKIYAEEAKPVIDQMGKELDRVFVIPGIAVALAEPIREFRKLKPPVMASQQEKPPESKVVAPEQIKQSEGATATPAPSIAKGPKVTNAHGFTMISAHTEESTAGQAVRGIIVSPDGSFFVSWSYTKILKVWSLPAGEPLKALDQEESLSHVAISNDAKSFFTSHFLKDEIRKWSVQDGKCIEVLDGAVGWPRLDITADGKYLIGSALKAELFSLPDGKFLRLRKDYSFFTTIGCVPALSGDGKLFAVGTEDSRVKVWSLPDGQLLHNLGGHESTPHISDSGVYCVAFSPDGKALASGASDKRAIVWSVLDGKRLLDLKEHEGMVVDLAFSHDGKVLASASSDNTVRLWSIPEGKSLHTFPGYLRCASGCAPLAFTPDNCILPVVGNDTITLWSVKEGKRLARLEGHKNRITAVQMTRDGKYLVSGDHLGNIIIWELPSAPPSR